MNDKPIRIPEQFRQAIRNKVPAYIARMDNPDALNCQTCGGRLTRVWKMATADHYRCDKCRLGVEHTLVQLASNVALPIMERELYVSDEDIVDSFIATAASDYNNDKERTIGLLAYLRIEQDFIEAMFKT